MNRDLKLILNVWLSTNYVFGYNRMWKTQIGHILDRLQDNQT